MPKAPILNRETFYTKIRDGSFRRVDWNLVNTSLGAMVEPRQIVGVDRGKVVQFDPFDGSFNRQIEIDENRMFQQMGTAGQQVPIDFNPF